MEIYDFAIIGAGGAGLASAMYAARLGLKTIVFGHTYSSGLPIGGLITTTHVVENYPGFKKTSGLFLAKQLEEHARNYDLVNIKQEEVKEVSKKGACFTIKTNKQECQVAAVLFATGRKIRKLDVPGVKEYENKGVGYCALCDAPLHKNQIVGVIGGSDAAAVEALVLAEYAKKVYIIYRGEVIRAEPTNLDKINMSNKIEVINDTNVLEIKGDEKGVTGVLFDNEHEGSKELALHGVYMAIGSDPLSELAQKLGVKVNEKKEIMINHINASTNIPGIYAAGDVADKPFKQLITGVAEGVTAAHSAYEYISEKKLHGCGIK